MPDHDIALIPDLICAHVEDDCAGHAREVGALLAPQHTRAAVL